MISTQIKAAIEQAAASNGHITAAGLETQLEKFRDAIDRSIATALQNGGGSGGGGGGSGGGGGASGGGDDLLLLGNNGAGVGGG
eukprot:SAG22_NODE_10456_length_534_cov_2.627586_2_plen_83_part_01